MEGRVEEGEFWRRWNIMIYLLQVRRDGRADGISVISRVASLFPSLCDHASVCEHRTFAPPTVWLSRQVQRRPRSYRYRGPGAGLPGETLRSLIARHFFRIVDVCARALLLIPC